MDCDDDVTRRVCGLGPWAEARARATASKSTRKKSFVLGRQWITTFRKDLVMWGSVVAVKRPFPLKWKVKGLSPYALFLTLTSASPNVSFLQSSVQVTFFILHNQSLACLLHFLRSLSVPHLPFSFEKCCLLVHVSKSCDDVAWELS